MIAPRKRAKPTFGKAPKSTAQIARQALALAKRNANSVELKRYDLTAVISPTQSVTSVNLAPLAKGVDENDRVGSEVSLKRVNLNFTARQSSSATEATFIRVILCVKKAPGNFDAATYFETTTTDEEVTSLRAWDTMGHYKTLHDKVYLLDGGAAAQFSGANNMISVAIPAGAAKAVWDGAGNHEANSVWLAVTSNLTTNVPEFTYSARVSYTDA